VLTVLPCGGLGELDPSGDTMEIRCKLHRTWDLGAGGRCNTVLASGALHFVYSDAPSCGAITSAATGVRRVVGYAEGAS
jgi:hypothetical protein